MGAANNGNGNLKRLTGKQASFVDKYLGEARFNASLAAKLAGYKATSKHSFEAIGSENLAKAPIRKTIDDYFRVSRMTADEVLNELSELARGSSKDKIRALALLSSHFGILDGAGAGRQVGGPVKFNVVYDQDGHAHTHKVVRVPPKVSEEEWSQLTSAIEKVYGRPITNEERADRIIDIVQTAGQWHEEADQFNLEAKKNNDRIEGVWDDLLVRFKDSAEAVEALTLLRNAVHFNCGDQPCLTCQEKGSVTTEKPEPIEPEIIPPDRRLQPAAVERLMRDASEKPRDQRELRPSAPAELPAATAREGRIRPYGYCQPIDGDEVERIKERDRDRVRIPMIY